MHMRAALPLAFAALLIGLPAYAQAHDLRDMPVTSQRLGAAAAPFKALTEIAFAKGISTLREDVAAAEAAGRAVRTLLPTAQRPDLDVQLDNIRIALRQHARERLARAALDGYHILIAAMPGRGIVPKAVPLLDYAGLRYRDDLDASVPHWWDMKQAAHLARTRWDGLAPRVNGADLRFRMDEAVNGMQVGAHEHDVTMARRSVGLERHLASDMKRQFQIRALRATS